MQKRSLKISASILSADFTHLANEVARVEASGIDFLHLDIMDGVFVPNLTFGADITSSLRQLTDMSFDVHLMVENPDKYIERFANAGANYVTVHAEACVHLDRTLELIKSFNMKAGIALNPATHESVLEYVLDKVDMVLVMSVNPGFAGQSYISTQTQKIKNIRTMLDKPGSKALLSVDGGINDKTVHLAKDAGADMVVSGAYLFKHADIQKAVQSLR